MSAAESAKFKQVMNNPKLVEKIISTPQAQALYKKNNRRKINWFKEEETI